MSIQSEINRLSGIKADIAAAITEKGGAVASTDSFQTYGNKIRALPSGVDTSDATATAEDILAGKTAYAKGQKHTGTAQPMKTKATMSQSGYFTYKISSFDGKKLIITDTNAGNLGCTLTVTLT